MRRDLKYNFTGSTIRWPAVYPNDGDIEIQDAFYSSSKYSSFMA